MTSGTGIATGFFTCAAAGILSALLVVPRAELGRFFSALNAGTAFGFLSLTAPFRVSPPAAWDSIAGSMPGALAPACAAAALILTAAFVTALYLPGGRGGRGVPPGGRAGTWLLPAAAGAALVTTALDGWEAARGGAAGWTYGVNALAGAAVLGSVIVAMILGHWYLVRQGLPERHLVRFALLFAAALGIRTALLAAGLMVHGSQTPAGLARFLRGVAVDRGVFFWQRVFFGIAAPAVLAWMVYETARIRSTQSATGILYLALIFVMIGEFLARYLAVAGAGPM